VIYGPKVCHTIVQGWLVALKHGRVPPATQYLPICMDMCFLNGMSISHIPGCYAYRGSYGAQKHAGSPNLSSILAAGYVIVAL
jgi:hypothetical protein